MRYQHLLAASGNFPGDIEPGEIAVDPDGQRIYIGDSSNVRKLLDGAVQNPAPTPGKGWQEFVISNTTSSAGGTPVTATGTWPASVAAGGRFDVLASVTVPTAGRYKVNVSGLAQFNFANAVAQNTGLASVSPRVLNSTTNALIWQPTTAIRLDSIHGAYPLNYNAGFFISEGLVAEEQFAAGDVLQMGLVVDSIPTAFTVTPSIQPAISILKV
jgi:hypothetical protein